jgi:hypothetical protein
VDSLAAVDLGRAVSRAVVADLPVAVASLGVVVVASDAEVAVSRAAAVDTVVVGAGKLSPQLIPVADHARLARDGPQDFTNL